MKETWSAMRKIIAPIMFVALATAGMTVAGSTAARADASTITFDGSTYDSIATAYGCDWWTSANDAKADGTNSTGKALQCSHPGTSGVRLTATTGMTFTSSSASSVSFNIFSMDNPTTVKVRIVAEGVAAPETTLSIPTGWSSQTVDFSAVDGYVSTGSYKRLDIEGSGEGHFWVDNINLLIDAPAAPVVTETSGSKTITFDGADYDSLASSYGCDWWTSANDAKADATYSAGKALQCSHDAHESGIRVTATGGKTITSSSYPSVTFNVNRQADAAGSLLVRINAPGVAASEVTLSGVPAGWSTQTVDFSAASSYSASAPYTVLDIAETSVGHIWVDNIAFYLTVPGAAVPSASPSAAPAGSINIDFDGAANDSIAGTFGCNWWTSVNNAKATADITGKQLQCSHEWGGGIRLEGTGITFTSGTYPKVSFDIYTENNSAQVSLLGSTSAPKVNLTTVANGWSHQVIDFSSATFADASTWSASDTYTRLDITNGDANSLWVDNIKANQTIASVTPSASPSSTAPATPVVASIKLDSADLGPAGVYSVGNGWWNEGSGSRSVVKYLPASGTWTLNYTVLDTDGNPVEGAGVTLATSGGANDATTGSRTATTNALGKVTFTLVNSTTNANAEWPRQDSTVWSDPETAAVAFEAIPYISGSSRNTQCYSTANASTCNRDRVWGHVVSTSAYTNMPKTLIRLVANDKSAMTDKSGWYTDTPANRSMVKMVTAGNKLVLHYQVSEGGTPVGAGRTVTLAKNVVTAGSDFTGSLTATTNSSGIATFVLTNTNTSGETRPVAPSSLNYWDDSRNQGANTEVQFSPTVSPLNTAITNYDRVWVHIVNKPSSQGVPAAPYQVTAKRSGAKQITVDWNAATEDGNANTGYEVTLTPKTGAAVVATASASATSLAVNVSIVTAYTATVKAINSAGKSAATAASGAVSPSATAPKAPNAPTMGTSPIRGVDALWMPFSPSGVDSGATASGYQYSIDNGVNWQDATFDSAKPGTILFLYGLTSGKAYSVKVRATNSFGVGAASAAKATSTATAPTAAPVLGTVSFVNGTLTIGFTGLTAAQNGGSPITGYQYSTNGGTNWNNMTRDQVLANKVILTGLSVASRTIKVRAFNGLYSAASAAKVVSAPLATPAFTVVAGTGKVTLTITALASTSTGNSAVTYQYTKNNGSTWITAAAGATIITASKGTAVSVKVRAVNSVGDGAASATAKSATAK